MSNLKLCEREKIEFYLRCKQGVREIARLIRRDHSVVSREIQRNGGISGYDAKRAQAAADKRVGHNRKRKMEKYPELKTYVVNRLKKDWSPEQITGRLKKDAPPAIHGKRISHESIYQYIYEGEGRFEYLYPHLRRGKRKRQKRYARKAKKTMIPLRTSIHDRPKVVDQRKRYGDWESDTMVCRKQREAVSVQTERKSKLVRITKLANKSAEETTHAIIATAESVSKAWRRSMTFDNGGEGARHMMLKERFRMKTYFCDPYASWQKGGVENMNGLIRQYIPKNADLSSYTPEDVHAIQERLNDRPRKSLNYRTPNEISHTYGGQVVH